MIDIVVKVKQREIAEQLYALESVARKQWATGVGVGDRYDLLILRARLEALGEATEIARGMGPR